MSEGSRRWEGFLSFPAPPQALYVPPRVAIRRDHDREAFSKIYFLTIPKARSLKSRCGWGRSLQPPEADLSQASPPASGGTQPSLDPLSQ